MEPEGSLPHSQKPATCLYPELDQFSPRLQPTSLKSILILSSHQCLRIPSGLLPSGFPAKNPVSIAIPQYPCYMPVHLIGEE